MFHEYFEVLLLNIVEEIIIIKLPWAQNEFIYKNYEIKNKL